MSARSAAMEKIAPERCTDVNGETSMAAEPIRRLFTTAEYHTMAESGILSEGDQISPLAFPDLQLEVDAILG
jgi:hypothetical protein